MKSSVFTCSVFTGSAVVEVPGFCCVDEVEEVEELEVELCELPPPPLYPPPDDEELEPHELSSFVHSAVKVLSSVIFSGKVGFHPLKIHQVLIGVSTFRGSS